MPEIASRRHCEAISATVKKALADAQMTMEDVDAVAGCLPEVPAAGLETLVHYGADDLARALAAVDAGTPGTVELSPCIDVEETIALAKEKGAHAVLVLENGSERRVEL